MSRPMPTGTVMGVAWSLALLAGCGDSTGIGDRDGGGGGSDAGEATSDTGPGPDAGGGLDAGWAVPVFRNPVDLPDEDLAREALEILGAPEAGATEERCLDCHAISRQNIRWWRAQSDVALASCLTDLSVASQASATATLECFRPEPGMPYVTSRLGIFATAAPLDWFRYVFYTSAPETWEADHADFVERVGMPRGDHPALTQEEFDVVAEWFIRGVPEVDSILPLETPPDGCTPGISSDVAEHVAEMTASGWGAVNRENGILMYGCAGATTPRECLSTETAAADTTFGADWDHLDGSVLRVLFTTDYSSAYWTRSSADGRFVGHGANVMSGPASRIIDLEGDRVIAADALYDPGFFPDNSGFAFQDSDAHFCEQSVLTTGEPTLVTFRETGCRTNEVVGLYQHIGASLGGGDYWTVDGQFESDDGGHRVRHTDPRAPFSLASRARLTPMVNDGMGFTPGRTTAVPQPYEGDTVLSPSSRLILSRVAGPGASQLGFVLRQMLPTPRSEGTGYDIETPEIARYCFNGGKPAFSFDERWLVLHHYIGGADAVELGFTGPTDPGFAQYNEDGGANIYLVDIRTGELVRITHMAPGQYALFPHFRSDGWIYFVVRSPGSRVEHVVASDAALVLGG
jgi:hypothetical protein